MEKIFTEGIWFNKRKDGMPEFVIGSMAVKVKKFTEWLSRQEVDESGYIRLRLLDGRNGKPYFLIDTWRPEKMQGFSLEKPKIDYPEGGGEIPF